VRLDIVENYERRGVTILEETFERRAGAFAFVCVNDAGGVASGFAWLVMVGEIFGFAL